MTKVKDEYEKIRYEINQKLAETEACLAKKEEYKTNDPRDVLKRTEYQDKIDRNLKEIEDGLSKLETVLRSQKNKPKKYGDVSHKEEAKKLMEDRYRLLVNKNEGLPIDEKELNDNRTNLEKLEALIDDRNRKAVPDRELYQEEKDIMDGWKTEVDRQDKVLEGVGDNIKKLKGEVRQIGNQIDETGKKIKKTAKMADKTEETLKTSNAKLKELLEKVRSGDKICIDIILICICLGLIAVLYNVIKSKTTSSTTSSGTTNSTRFLTPEDFYY